ncbi:hypothetical protein RJT34_09426 [Clitoria ternatea]|uniref:Uncharacterized protein n=1 Tax=Clitoria ternatea TaxID=43366 RepID=A0AAN9K873_CLITE
MQSQASEAVFSVENPTRENFTQHKRENMVLFTSYYHVVMCIFSQIFFCYILSFCEQKKRRKSVFCQVAATTWLCHVSILYQIFFVVTFFPSGSKD